MSRRVIFEDVVDLSKRSAAINYGNFRVLVRPTATENNFAQLFRAVCCAWCRAGHERIIDPGAQEALVIIEEFVAGRAAGDSLAIARKRAAIAARRVARRAGGKTKEYWACHAVCEAARNSALESLSWTSVAAMNAGIFIDQKLAIFRKVVEETPYAVALNHCVAENSRGA